MAKEEQREIQKSAEARIDLHDDSTTRITRIPRKDIEASNYAFASSRRDLDCDSSSGMITATKAV